MEPDRHTNDADAIPSELAGILEFMRATESLKINKRSGRTSLGEAESVAEHSWRVTLFALVLHSHFPDTDFTRLIKICIIHDLGEAINGDIPAPVQASRTASKAGDERRDLQQLLSPLPDSIRHEILALWDEYEAAATPEARLAKAVDKLETILQHVQGDNEREFDYAFNLTYGREHTGGHPVLEYLRQVLDEETADKAKGD